MKTKEELNALKEEIETLSRERRELTDEEKKQVTGGGRWEEGYSEHAGDVCDRQTMK